MWLFTTYGFYSIVKKMFGNQKEPFQVRSRAKEDLLNIIKAADINRKVIETPEADYHFRITVDNDDLSKILQTLQDGLDYDNFKAAVGKVKGQTDKLDSYHRIWAEMYHYQGLKDGHN